MPRSRSGFYSTIEYIGPRPQKPKRPNIFGGWVIILIALTANFIGDGLRDALDPTASKGRA